VPPRDKAVKGTHFPGKAARALQRLILERRYGMPRGALRDDIDLADIGFDAPGRVREHIPSPQGVLRRILPRREVGHSDVFIDIGCGMGPVVVEAAARYDFRRVIGVDIVPQFTEVARKTIARGRRRLRCEDVAIVTADVTEYELPDDVTVVYMADPFQGPTFDAVIAKLLASVDRRPRQLRIIYHNPAEGARLERSGRAHLVRFGRHRTRPWRTTPELAMYEIDSAGSSPDGETGSDGGRLRRPASRNPVVQVNSDPSTHRSSVVSKSPAQLESARTEFEDHHCVRLPGFLDEPVLDRIRSYVDEGEFSIRRYRGMPIEPRMDAGKAAGLLLLLINDPALFDLVRAITRCRRIGRFDGAIRRMIPGREHEEPWHGEIFGHGLVGMSIDLSAGPYSGGVVQMRDRYSYEVYTEVDTEPGDAVLVRLAPFLQRRVTAVEGGDPRTSYSGRFMLRKKGAESRLARPGAGELTMDAGSSPRRPPATPRR